jgi:hypothetical protein
MIFLAKAKQEWFGTALLTRSAADKASQEA